MDDWLTILGALGGLEAIKWTVNFYVNRKTNARKEDASAVAVDYKDKQHGGVFDWLDVIATVLIPGVVTIGIVCLL